MSHYRFRSDSIGNKIIGHTEENSHSSETMGVATVDVTLMMSGIIFGVAISVTIWSIIVAAVWYLIFGGPHT